MIEKTIQLFTYAELSEEGKENARNWWLSCRDSSDMEFVTDDFQRICDIIGVDLKMRPYQTVGGNTRYEPSIRWGLYSQGSGASFEGSYAYKKGAAKAIRAYAPKDALLHAIADELQAWQRIHCYGIRATMSDGPGSNFYPHSGTMSVEVEFLDSHGNERDKYCDGTAKHITRLMRSLADWLYAVVEKEDMYQCSDEYIADAMEANEYTFRENGDRED